MTPDHNPDLAARATAPVIRAAHVRRTPSEAFEIFTAQIAQWWPMETHSVYGAYATVSFDGDRLVERGPAGQESLWATATTWDPPRRIVLQWHPGRGPGDASEVEISFEEETDGTRVVIEHRGWERFGADAEQRRSGYAGPNAWGSILDHYAAVADQA